MENITNYIVDLLSRSGLLERDLECHLLRAAMVIIFAWFGYDKWFEDEIRGLLRVTTHGPLIFWTIPVLGIRDTSLLLRASEWTFGTLLFLGFWNKRLGILGALGFHLHFRRYPHGLAVRSPRVGCGRRRLSSDDGEFRLPFEGSRLAGCLPLLAKARCGSRSREPTLRHGGEVISWPDIDGSRRRATWS